MLDGEIIRTGLAFSGVATHQLPEHGLRDPVYAMQRAYEASNNTGIRIRVAAALQGLGKRFFIAIAAAKVIEGVGKCMFDKAC